MLCRKEFSQSFFRQNNNHEYLSLPNVFLWTKHAKFKFFQSKTIGHKEMLPSAKLSWKQIDSAKILNRFVQPYFSSVSVTEV